MGTDDGPQSAAVREMFAAAVQRHRASDFAQAEPLYRRILAIDPRHGEALYLLGMVGAQSGRYAEAADLITRAIALRPDFAEARYNLGNALRALGRGEAAAAAYR